MMGFDESTIIYTSTCKKCQGQSKLFFTVDNSTFQATKPYAACSFSAVFLGALRLLREASL
jgi:hypothetical protein